MRHQVKMNFNAACWTGTHRVRSRRSNTFSTIFYLAAGILLSTFQPSIQVLEFQQEPEPYYYSLPGTATTIPCHVIENQADGSPLTLNATFFRNSTPVNIYQPPPHYHALPEDGTQKIIGLLILPTTREDHKTFCHCKVEKNGEVMMSQRSTIYVGDGTPFPPVESPYQVSETISTVTIGWGYSPVPSDHPLLGYSIRYWLQNQMQEQAVTVQTHDNATTITLDSLKPGSTYSVVVHGRNSLGLSEAVVPVNISTISGELPPAPTIINVSVEMMNERREAVVTVSWMGVTIEADVTTPVQNYLVYYSSSASEMLVATTSNSSRNHSFTLRTSGSFRVGVASRNFAGRSDISYFHEVSKISFPAATPIILIAPVVSICLFFVLLSIITFLLIFFLRKKTHSYDFNNQNMKLDGKSTDSTDSKKSSYSSESIELGELHKRTESLQ